MRATYPLLLPGPQTRVETIAEVQFVARINDSDEVAKRSPPVNRPCHQAHSSGSPMYLPKM